ncbi:MAG: hypothetical protein ACKOC1_03030 [Hyphomicrobiales bacterium]
MVSDRNDQGTNAMEISTLPSRPQASPAPHTPQLAQQIGTVGTDLPEARAVTAIPALAQMRHRPENNQTPQVTSNASIPSNRDESDLRSRTRRQTVMDWSTNQPVFRIIDERSGQTISQNPDQALLRLRAYARQQNLAWAEKNLNSAS